MDERDVASTAVRGVLLIERDSGQRKHLRRAIEGAGYAALAVNSIGEGLARLRAHHYDLVLCTDRNNSVTISEDYGPIIDATGLLARSSAGYELYLPGIGIDARAVLIELAGNAGPEYRVGFANFHAITRYNRSALYASAVNDLAEALEATPAPAQPPDPATAPASAAPRTEPSTPPAAPTATPPVPPSATDTLATPPAPAQPGPEQTATPGSDAP